MDEAGLVALIAKLRARARGLGDRDILLVCKALERYMARFREVHGRRGRPRTGRGGETFKATRPWEREGVSERTWYRRRAEARDA